MMSKHVLIPVACLAVAAAFAGCQSDRYVYDPSVRNGLFDQGKMQFVYVNSKAPQPINAKEAAGQIATSLAATHSIMVRVREDGSLETLAASPVTNVTSGVKAGEIVSPITADFGASDEGQLYFIICYRDLPGRFDRGAVWTAEELALADAHITALKSAIASTLPAPSLPLESSNAQN